jgi:hypothetical protein
MVSCFIHFCVVFHSAHDALSACVGLLVGLAPNLYLEVVMPVMYSGYALQLAV